LSCTSADTLGLEPVTEIPTHLGEHTTEVLRRLGLGD